jgi:SsrA-binding protein
MAKNKKQKTNDNLIAQNKKARFDYFIEDTLEAGLKLEGWEVKSLRDKRVQLKESYVIFKHDNLWLFGAHISPLSTVSSHVVADPVRTRKLLLNRKEINKIRDQVTQKGATAVALKLYWARGNVKLKLGVAKGKKDHDKRQTLKDRDWARDKNRILKQSQLD